MEKCLNSVIDGDTQYRVYEDWETAMDIDFQSEEEEAAHRRKLENGELINVIVSSYMQCSYCGNWKLQDSLGGIIVESEREAIEVFKEHFPLVATV